MTTDEYLKTCTNVPALPSGWGWLVSTDNVEKRSTVTDRIINWTKILIEITDRDGKVQGSRVVSIQTNYLTSYPEIANMELAQGFRAAYNNLYAAEKLNFYKVLNIDPASL